MELSWTALDWRNRQIDLDAPSVVQGTCVYRSFKTETLKQYCRWNLRTHITHLLNGLSTFAVKIHFAASSAWDPVRKTLQK